MAGGVVRELVTLWGFDIDQRPLKELDAGINTIKASLKAVGIATAATSAAIGFLLNEAGKQEQTNVAFETMLGNAEKAQQVIGDLQQFASRTPFTIPGIEQNAKQLLAVGIETNKLIPTLKALGDVSAGLSVPLERIALNYGQIRTQNKLTGRELRDFAVAGVPLLGELSKQLNVSEKEITEMVSAGQIGFSEVEKAFISMTSEGGRFANLMIKQSKTFKGLVSNAQDFFIIFSRELGQEILPAAKEVVSETINWLEANRELLKVKLIEFVKILVSFFTRMVQLIGDIFDGVNTLVQIFGGWNYVLDKTFKVLSAIMTLGLLTGIGLVTKAVFGLALAWRAMGTAALFAQIKMAAIPLAIGAVVAAIALIAEDILAFSQGRDSVFGRMMSGLDEIFSKLKDKFSAFGDIGKMIIAALLTPIRMVVNGFKNIIALIDIMRGKTSIMEGLKQMGANSLNAIGFNSGNDLSSAIGLTNGFTDGANQVNARNNPVIGLGGAPFKRGGQGEQKNVNVESTIDLSLNVQGMDQENAEKMVMGSIRKELGGVLRETVRDGENLVER